MKKWFVSACISVLLCASCNGTSSSTINKNSFYDAIEDKYSDGYIMIPNGIYMIQSKIDYHYDDGKANGFVNNIIFAEINNWNVTKLNQRFEGLVFNSLFNGVVSYIGDYNYDGKTKYEKTTRQVKHIYDSSISEDNFYYKEDMDEFMFDRTSDDLFYSFFKGDYFKYILYNIMRFHISRTASYFEDDKKIVERETTEKKGIMSKTIYLNDDLEYKKEELVFNAIYADAIFTYEKLDSYDFIEVENKEQYIENVCARSLQIV